MGALAVMGGSTRFGRGIAGLVESSWSGEPGTVRWTAALTPLAALVASASARAQERAARTRRPAEGTRVIAVGNLTVGGTGKSSVARWIAARLSERQRAAVLLRGYGGYLQGLDPEAVPDFAGYPLARVARRYGDEAASHRAALPRHVAVLVGRDRRRTALLARDGYAAEALVLDDGWEQTTLRWDALWVVLDPSRPEGNGGILPAGPLRRSPKTLAVADALVFLLEGPDEDVPPRTREWARGFAPRAPIVRFRRTLRGLSFPGRAETEPPATGAGPSILMTGVGAPARVERFARASGIEVLAHASFPDHARVSTERLHRILGEAARRGAVSALITEKDEHRWALPPDPPLPVRVLRTGLIPLDPVDSLPGIEIPAPMKA